MVRSPFFSIIVPTFNRCALLKEALESVSRQSFTDYEVIVVDNASTDGTVEFSTCFTKDPRFRYIRSETNKERAHSRNVGLENSRGLFVTFLDSDDLMYPNCLKHAYIFSLRYPEYNFFHNLFEFVDNSKKVIQRPTFPSLSNQYKALASGNFISCIGSFLHESRYRNLRFNTDSRMIGAEDYEIWFDVLAKCRMGRIQKVNSGVREHSGRSVHHGLYKSLLFQEDYLVRKINDSPLLAEKFGPWIPRLRANFALHRAAAAIGLGQKKAAATELFDAVSADLTVLPTRRSLWVFYNLFKGDHR